MNGFDATLEEVEQLADAEQIPALLQRVAERYSLKTVAYLGTGTLDRRVPRHEPYIAVTYSPEWVERYRARRYLNIDPAIQIGLRRLLPIDWDEFGKGGGSLRQFFGEAWEFGLGRRGISFPVHGYRGDRALFSVTADFNKREWQWARRTAFRHFPVIAAHLHEAGRMASETSNRPA